VQNHPYADRYRNVWQQTLDQGELPLDQIEKSRYYFETDLTNPTPKEFDATTYGIAALLPMPDSAQPIFTALWDEIMESLGHPVAYAVEPQNRHVEFLVFTRPEEIVDDNIVQRNIAASFAAVRATPPVPFKVAYSRPFITPDGTIVAPGFPLPETIIDDFRAQVREATHQTLPQKQSQWFHTPLGRILEPLDRTRLKSTLDAMESRWGEPVVTLEIDELLWTSESQWYMVKKSILHRLSLRQSQR